MSSKLKGPPVFDSTAGSYERWKEDLAIWQILTDLSPPKQAQYLYLSLTGKAKSAVGDVKAADIATNEEGVKFITDKLDQVFLKDANTRAFYAFQEFYDYKRGDGDSFETFIVRFEQLYNKVAEFKMVLPDGVRAFFILRAANISAENNRLLVRTTAGELSYAQVKDKLKKVFGNLSGDDDGEDISVKEEEDVMYSTYNNNRGGRGRSRGRSRSRSRGGRGGSRGRGSPRPGNTNEGASSSSSGPKCHLCFGTDHLVMQCPHRGSFEHSLGNNTYVASADTHDVHIVLLHSKADNKQLALVRESLGKGLLDTGCTKTVAGETWMIEFLETLSPVETEKVKEDVGAAKFRFGDGVEYKSNKELIIPVVIGSVHQFMKVDLVPCEIPLLISVNSMKRMNMTLDCGNNVAYAFGKCIDLSCTTS